MYTDYMSKFEKRHITVDNILEQFNTIFLLEKLAQLVNLKNKRIYFSMYHRPIIIKYVESYRFIIKFYKSLTYKLYYPISIQINIL